MCDPDDGCQSTGDPCTPFGQQCNEATDSCEELCSDDADCDDGNFCNGSETCVDGECSVGTDPCAEGETCTEQDDTCTATDDPTGQPVPDNTLCGASGNGCTPAGPAVIFIFLGLLALRFTGAVNPAGRRR
jgi:hypothetical protein